MLSLLRNSVFRPYQCQNRQFWKWLNVIFNRPDFDRISKVGPDRSCGEWLLKNGAKLKWTHNDDIITNFNDLPMGTIGYLLEEVIAEEASINYEGFIHFHGCKHIKRIVFDKCDDIDDKAMEELRFVQESPLKHLEINSCHTITDEGLKKIPEFKTMETIVLSDLFGVKRLLLCADHLQKKMPQAELFVNGNKWRDDAHKKNETT